MTRVDFLGEICSLDEEVCDNGYMLVLSVGVV